MPNLAFTQRIAEIDGQLPELAEPINVLKYLNWPEAIEDKFLAGLARWSTGVAGFTNFHPGLDERNRSSR
jgi:hypothetical protein